MKIEIDSNDFGRRAILFLPNLVLTVGLMVGVIFAGVFSVGIPYILMFPDIVITNNPPFLMGAIYSLMAFVFCLGLQFLGYIATMGLIVLENSKHRI